MNVWKDRFNSFYCLSNNEKTMKTLVFLIITLGFACSDQAQSAAAKKQINSNIAAHIKQNAGNPASYQFVSTILIDTLRRSDRVEKDVYREMEVQKSQIKLYGILL
jgi:hypothetical protein